MIKNKRKEKKITINTLASMMKDGFGGVNKKIDHIEDSVDKLAISTKNNFDRLEAKMATKEALKTQQDVLEITLKEITAIHEDNKSFRDNISTLYIDHVSYDRKIENLTVRVEKLEVKTK